MIEVATIVVNYRTSAAAIAAVETLHDDLAKLQNPLVVVVDNDSRDGSVDRLNAAFSDPKWAGRVIVLASEHNGGFGSGVNLGIQHVLSQYGAPTYFYVLNPDAAIDPGALIGLVRFMEQHPDAGLLGNVVRNQTAGADVVRAFRFPTFLSEFELGASFRPFSKLLQKHIVPYDPGDSCEVDWVSGVSMLFRREVFTSAGFFDEAFFLYFEEVDHAKRIREAGWKVYYVADVGVDHVGGLSTGIKDANRRVPTYWFDSRRRYFVKHHGRLYAALCDLAWISGHAIYKTKTRLLGKQDEAKPKVGRDFLRYALSHFLRPAPEAEQSLSRPAKSPA